jgi:sugar/nucleoside kinase (ribokinase family)
MPEFDVTGIGLNATDTVFRVPRFPAFGGKAPFSGEHYSVGGQMASAIVTCAKLGLRSKYIGAVGDDYRGQLQIESLEESGVNIDHVRRRVNCPNQSAYIVIDEATGERTVFWNHADCLTLQPDEITPDQILGTRLLHVDCHDTAAVEKAARLASENGIPVTADVDTLYAGFDRVLPFIDYLVASSEFPTRLTGIEDPFRALRAIQERHGLRVAAMTLGAHGALALDRRPLRLLPRFRRQLRRYDRRRGHLPRRILLCCASGDADCGSARLLERHGGPELHQDGRARRHRHRGRGQRAFG